MQRSGAEAIRTQIQPSKPKRGITNITNGQNTKRTSGQLSEQLYPKRWPHSNRKRTKNMKTPNHNFNNSYNLLQILIEADPINTHNLCFRAEIRKMYTVNF